MLDAIKEYWAQLSAVGAALVWAGRRFMKRLHQRREREKELDAWRNTMQASILTLLHDRLLYECLHYLACEEITADEMDNLSLMYNQYVKLGGNGTVKKLMERVGMYVKIIECDCERGYDT